MISKDKNNVKASMKQPTNPENILIEGLTRAKYENIEFIEVWRTDKL